MIKCLITDLDGTLFHNHKVNFYEISDRNIKALKRAKELGITVAIASGRMISYGKMVADLYDLEPKIVSGFNGAISSFKDKQEKFSLDINRARDLFNEVSVRDDISYLQVQTLDSYRIFNDLNSPVYKRYATQSQKLKLDIVLDVDLKTWLKDATSPIGKFSICIEDREVLHDLMLKLRQEYPDLHVTRSSGILMEIMNKKANKGRFVDFVKNNLNLKTQEIATIGDNHNDEDMLKKSGMSFIMQSGDKRMLNKADYIVEDVAQAIEIIERRNYEDSRCN